MGLAVDERLRPTVHRGTGDGAQDRPAPWPPRTTDACHFASAPVALCIINRQRRFEAVNLCMAELLGSQPDSLAGRFVASALADADTILSSCFAKADVGEPLADLDIAWQGRRFQLSFSALVEDGRVRALSVAAADISRRVRTEERLLKSRQRLLSVARQDHLTGLLNRRGLEVQLQRELRRACAAWGRVALLLVDIDHFKLYNDTFGHSAGDECLRAVAGELNRCGQGVAAVARYGGEEFALVVPDASSSVAAGLADRCRQAINELRLQHPAAERKHVTISIGVASLEVRDEAGAIGTQGFELLRAADESLYRAKRLGRDRISVAAIAL